MNSVIRLSSIVMLALLVLGSGAALAQLDSQNSVDVSLATGDGETIDFSLAVGGAVVIDDSQKGLSYRLSLADARHDGADLRLEHFDANGEKSWAEDFVSLPIDGSFGSLGASELSVAVTGVTLSATAPMKGLADAASDDPLVRASCCVTCGRWTVCCTPAPGWCCTVNSSCGESCTACGGPGIQ